MNCMQGGILLCATGVPALHVDGQGSVDGTAGPVE